MLYEDAQNTRFIEGLFHLIFWILFIHFIFDLGGLYDSFEHLFSSKEEKKIDEAFLLIPIAFGLFYWNFTYLIPKFLYKGRWEIYGLCLLVSYILIHFSSVWLYDLLRFQGFHFFIPKQEFTDHLIQFNLQIVIASTALGVAKTAMRNLTLKREAEQKQKEAELKYLTNQFNPHFLHNTLNGIYAMAMEENAPKTTEAILQLSEIMRYPIHQVLKYEAPLAEEVAFIEDYIALQKLRLGETYPIHFKTPENINDIHILPLSLIILVENAFKYGVSTKNNPPINIQLSLDKESIHFTTDNHIKNSEAISSHKIGLQNLTARLQLRYKNQYSLSTEQRENRYIIRLSLERK